MECAGREGLLPSTRQMHIQLPGPGMRRLQPPVLTHRHWPSAPLTPLEVAEGFPLAHHCLTPSPSSPQDPSHRRPWNFSTP